MTHSYVIFIFVFLLLTVNVSADIHASPNNVEAAMKRVRAFKVETGTCSSPGMPAGQHKFTVSRPEGERTYYAYVPVSYNNSVPVPLHISFHGLGDTCLNYGPAVGFQKVADLRDFIYVYPCGIPGLLGENAWAAGTCCATDSKIDDVALTRDIVAAMQNQFCIDKTRIVASGFSNGAMMAEILACEAADLFQAVASVSGVVELKPGNAQGLTNCDSDFANNTGVVDVINIHGDADGVVPWTGDALLGFPTIPDDFAAWGKRLGCTDTPKQTLNKGHFTNQVYTTCKNSRRVELVRNAGGSHEWPSDADFDTTSYVADFLKL